MSANTTSIHYDGRFWDQSKEFRPERWLDENGKFFMPKEGFLPFGVGKFFFFFVPQWPSDLALTLCRIRCSELYRCAVEKQSPSREEGPLPGNSAKFVANFHSNVLTYLRISLYIHWVKMLMVHVSNS